MIRNQPIRSGSSNLFANWQIVAIGLLEALFYTYAVAPIGRELIKGAGGRSFLMNPSVMTVSAAIALAVIVVAALLVNAFVTAGNALVYVAGEHAALTAHAAPNDVRAYRAFHFNTWWQAGRGCMWRVAGVYALVMGALLPFFGVIAAAAMLLPKQSGSVSCLALGIIFPFALAAILAAIICSEKAVVLVVGQSQSARAALRVACGQVIDDLGEHIWAVIVIGFVTGIASSLVSGAESVLSSSLPGSSPSFSLATSVELALSGVKGAIAVANGCWLLSVMTAFTDIREQWGP